jgi:hypothetical protein
MAEPDENGLPEKLQRFIETLDIASAAGLILAATLAMVHARQAEARSAYASVIAPVPATAEPGSRVVGDGDAAIHYILSH